MTQDILIPQMGESITEGVLASWIVEDGAYVNEGDPLFELETDKVTTEVPAPFNGVIKIQAEEGAVVEIGAVVASIDPNAAAPASSETANSDNDDSEKTPAAETKVEAEPEKKPTETAGKAGPAARKILSENNIDSSSVSGSGRHGTITKQDAIDASKKSTKTQTNTAAAPASASESTSGQTRKRMSSLRQRIATRLVQAQHTAAILSTFNEIDMHNCMELRKRLKDDFEETHGVRLGFMSFFTKACAEALKAYPLINSQIDGTDIISYDQVNMSIAVGTDKGLVVPVLRAVDQMGFADIEREIRAVAKKARDGKLTIDDMSGGTFTITNGGVYGSLLSTPIINPPQSGILGMHSIQQRPVAIDGQVVIRPMMYIALSYDHRIVDGAEAVGFLVKVKQLIEDPERMLLGL